tara:strand:+ start:949 stop:1152 length:204 start_codon:yes stop_codon:yes gene_type:complete
MATATVYTIKDDMVVDQFDCDYNYAVGAFWGKPNPQGQYYVARKGIPIPFETKKKLLKDVKRQVDQE